MGKFIYRFRLEQTAYSRLGCVALFLVGYSLILFFIGNKDALLVPTWALKIGLILFARCGQLYLFKLNARIEIENGRISWFDWTGQKRCSGDAHTATIVRTENSFKIRIDTDGGKISGVEKYDAFCDLINMDRGGPAVMFPLHYKKRKVFPFQEQAERIAFIAFGLIIALIGCAIILTPGDSTSKHIFDSMPIAIRYLIGSLAFSLGSYLIGHGFYVLSSLINRRIEVDDEEILLFDWRGRLKLRSALATSYFPFVDANRHRSIKTQAGEITKVNQYRHHEILAEQIKPYSVASALGIVVPTDTNENRLRQSS